MTISWNGSTGPTKNTQRLSRYFEEETRFVEAVKRGEEALQRGEYLTHEQVGQRLEPLLQP